MSDQDTYPNAGRASGYTDEGGNDVGENIINRVTELLIAPQTKMLQLATQLEETRVVQEETRIVQDQRFGYILAQMGAFLEKEDKRHDFLSKNEVTTERALANVALSLDKLTGLVQTSITIARDAHATGKEALAIAKTNKAQMATLKKAVVVLEKGQKASKQQWTEIVALLADSKSDRADLRQRINALSTVVEEHNRITAEHAALVHKVAELDARLAALEPHDDVKP